MSERERPKLACEDSVREMPDRPPHCDQRILHLPEECAYCAEATSLQAERVVKEVSNSGHANRKWPCPADEARGKAQYSAWPGNRAKKES